MKLFFNRILLCAVMILGGAPRLFSGALDPFVIPIHPVLLAKVHRVELPSSSILFGYAYFGTGDYVCFVFLCSDGNLYSYEGSFFPLEARSTVIADVVPASRLRVVEFDLNVANQVVEDVNDLLLLTHFSAPPSQVPTYDLAYVFSSGAYGGVSALNKGRAGALLKLCRELSRASRSHEVNRLFRSYLGEN